MGRMLGIQGESFSPNAKATIAMAGAGLLLGLMKKRNLLALACGGAALTWLSMQSCDSECMTSDAEEDEALEASVPRKRTVVHNS
jgi:hypothetical protein